MPIYTQSQIENMDADERKETCEWCWYRAFGNCNLCALQLRAKNTEQQVQADSPFYLDVAADE
jgi:hypothetical protein